MARSGPGAGAASSAPSLAPSWALPVAVVALGVGALLTGWVWHATRLDPVDAWVMRWQEHAYPHANGVAVIVSSTLPPVIVMTMVACAVLAWLAGRRDAVVLALAAAPATLAAELLLKQLVHRQWHGDPALLFPSGHSAVATAAAMTAVLVLRVVPVAPTARVVAACLGGGFVLVIAVARMVETVHSLTDIVGGATTGLVVTLGAALAIAKWPWRAGSGHVQGGDRRDARRRQRQSRHVVRRGDAALLPAGGPGAAPLERIIDEKSGRMLRFKNPCIVPDDVTCPGVYHRQCPRGIYPYWREVWLERVE
jgi:membrane-associated phospholipid phosphatase